MSWTAVLWCLLAFWVTGGHQLTAENKTTIVELHNRFRSLVVPSAANMRRMHWNESLAAIAVAYSTKCVWDHNPELVDIGENLFITNGRLNVSNAVTDWYEEHLDYTYKNNHCQEDKMCGHYTQVVWADSYAVGCASHLCAKMTGLQFENANLFICNYYPPGNFKGKLPYTSATAEKLISTSQPTSSPRSTTQSPATENKSTPSSSKETMPWTTSLPRLNYTGGACAVTEGSLTLLSSVLLLLLTM
ncbi:peptidase inhibitor 16 isoform X2 [Scleropages formosus]|uniref:peptidase inhibitor 16 isoform X2 n=1 Tax=Scleropages formosus TaxID=113540 RepID=UPI0008781DEF|nr:peptidase inhibitor 16-like isoform X2 [Scleropages formosus]